MIARIAAAVLAAAAVTTAALADTGKPARVPPRATATPVAACRQKPPAPRPSTHTPSAALVRTLGVLARPATAADALPKDALSAFPFGGRVMIASARRVADQGWLVPVEDVHWSFKVPAACLRTWPAAQRRAYERRARQEAKRAPVEGVLLVSGQPGGIAGAWSGADVAAGRTFSVDNCAGPGHDQLRVRGLVPTGIGSVTITARDGTTTDVSAQDDVAVALLMRPAKPAGLPAHVTLGATTIDLDARDSLTRPCEPPAAVGRAERLATPIKLKSRATIELATRRWESEDTLPLLAGATVRDRGRRCLAIASREQLERGLPKRRLCVSDTQLEAKGYIADARRLPDGTLVLEGFLDRTQLTWITVEHEPGGGARALWPAKASGAFFLAVRKGVPGHTFELHAMRRGGHGYTKLIRITP
jgi:hypothetical protein